MSSSCFPLRTSREEFCLNIVVRNKTNIVERQVAEHLGPPATDPTGLHQAATDVVARIANDYISAEQVTERVANTVLNEMRTQLSLRGIRAELSLSFQLGRLAVLKVAIVGADFAKLYAKGHMSTAALRLVQCFEFMPRLAHSVLHRHALQRIASVVLEELPPQVSKQLQHGGGVEAAVKALRMRDEAQYMFDALATMNAEDEDMVEQNSQIDHLDSFARAVVSTAKEQYCTAGEMLALCTSVATDVDKGEITVL